MTDKDDSKLIPLQGGGKPDITAEAVRQMKANLPHLLEAFPIIATQKKMYFDSLIKEGFSEMQAIQIVIAAPF